MVSQGIAFDKSYFSFIYQYHLCMDKPCFWLF